MDNTFFNPEGIFGMLYNFLGIGAAICLNLGNKRKQRPYSHCASRSRI